MIVGDITCGWQVISIDAAKLQVEKDGIVLDLRYDGHNVVWPAQRTIKVPPIVGLRSPTSQNMSVERAGDSDRPLGSLDMIPGTTMDRFELRALERHRLSSVSRSNCISTLLDNVHGIVVAISDNSDADE